MKVRLCIEYHGAYFSGWQIQSHQKTVQGELERALAVYLQSLSKQEGIQTPETPKITGSGRTDAGVHAKNQSASFTWPAELPLDTFRLKHSLNGISERGLFVKSAEEVDDSFDAKSSRHQKCYSYKIITSQGSSPLFHDRALSVPQKLNFLAMKRASQFIKGKHDFKSFQAAGCAAKTTIRTIHLSEIVLEQDNILTYYIVGNGFLKQMVRTIVGTLIEIGLGKRSPESMLEIIEAKERAAAGPVVEAKGLCLEWVRYE